ncbi:MAG: CapA family protein, partial [Kiritimatiellae bacterium]|nr:CapA family protein [Kiritimatiellia bacterium]
MRFPAFRDPVSPVRFRIAVAGDFCPGPNGSRAAAGGRASGVLAPLAPFLSDADLRLVQFETPLAPSPSPIPKTGPNLLSAPESAEVLRGLFDVALLANNHVGD